MPIVIYSEKNIKLLRLVTSSVTFLLLSLFHSPGVVILLWMRHTMTWASTPSLPTKIANFTKTRSPSSAITVIHASKHHLHLYFRNPVHIYIFLHSLCISFILTLPRAGVAQYMKIEWRVVAIFNVILFVVLVNLSHFFPASSNEQVCSLLYNDSHDFVTSLVLLWCLIVCFTAVDDILCRMLCEKECLPEQL